MANENFQYLFRCISYLFAYPSAEWQEGLEDCREFAESVPHKQISARLSEFVDYLQSRTLDELRQSYVNTIDFGKKTNLYVTYMQHGEQRERSMELVQLKLKYAKAGFQTTDRELPDYLPLMLEFAGFAPQNHAVPVLDQYQAAIEEMREQFIKQESVYALLLDVVLLVIEEFTFEHERRAAL
ncbi:nitrate reductase molybdenum cofactor assembly chaperone [Bacillus marinisedimentorum]|uniref:nitrate reductase molybdenum cofactor assembly chaperone n=1 Tax=Bacillus marinisedimentorum TaxID=1821260 RepID=UPI000872CBDB|nr:nitrate reductase molybdenum cofactor assembly chaperone [Bacillus marinisedimentorum]